jgi:hypothetical protein
MVWLTYGLALATPVLDEYGMSGRPLLGFEALCMGWVGAGVVPELANVALIVGWVGYFWRINILGLVGSVLALCLASTAPAVFGAGPGELRIGFYLWVLAMVVLVVASVVEVVIEQRGRQPS